MQCSAAMDILFLMDGSYSVGKGGFERSKHYAIKLCQALDIRLDKVGFLSHPSSLFFFLLSISIVFNHTGASRADSVWLHSSARDCLRFILHQTRAEEAHKENFIQVCYVKFMTKY